MNQSFRGPPPKDFLLELAQNRNRRPLPAVNESFGIRVPREHALLAPDWSTLAEVPGSNHTQPKAEDEEQANGV